MAMRASLVHRGLVPNRGFTLIELCIATAMGAILLLSLSDVAALATSSKRKLSSAMETQAQAAFVAQRLRLAAQAATVASLRNNTSGDTGGWLSPRRFCINGNKALVETQESDTGCGGTDVIADSVSRLTVAPPSGQTAVDAASVEVTVVLNLPDGTTGPTITQIVRIKGLLE
ncbi:MAG: hypothetical protein C4K60_03940 [Ideonella sp. MAG2]|nr:MAG: hypothetical protein C4K60_03940 [Ideonella sp. MAG2]